VPSWTGFSAVFLPTHLCNSQCAFVLISTHTQEQKYAQTQYPSQGLAKLPMPPKRKRETDSGNESLEEGMEDLDLETKKFHPHGDEGEHLAISYYFEHLFVDHITVIYGPDKQHLGTKKSLERCPDPRRFLDKLLKPVQSAPNVPLAPGSHLGHAHGTETHSQPHLGVNPRMLSEHCRKFCKDWLVAAPLLRIHDRGGEPTHGSSHANGLASHHTRYPNFSWSLQTHLGTVFRAHAIGYRPKEIRHFIDVSISAIACMTRSGLF